MFYLRNLIGIFIINHFKYFFLFCNIIFKMSIYNFHVLYRLANLFFHYNVKFFTILSFLYFFLNYIYLNSYFLN